MVHIDPIDYLNLIAIYFFLLVVRGSLIFASRPLLQILHKDKAPVTAAEAAIMTWGGLRGAVGLALGMQVNRGKAANEDGIPQISQHDADRVLFFVAGIAFLTTCVNAPTCPALVTWLGITALPDAEARMLTKFNQQLVHFSCSQDNPPEVTEQLRLMLANIAHDIEKAKRHLKPKRAMVQNQSEYMQRTEDIIECYRMAKEELSEMDQKDLKKIDKDCLPGDCNGEVPQMVLLLERAIQQQIPVDPDMAKTTSSSISTLTTMVSSISTSPSVVGRV